MTGDGTERKNENEVVSVTEAAAILGVSHQAVYHAIKRGAIKTVTRIKRVRAIKRSELAKYRGEKGEPSVAA